MAQIAANFEKTVDLFTETLKARVSDAREQLQYERIQTARWNGSVSIVMAVMVLVIIWGAYKMGQSTAPMIGSYSGFTNPYMPPQVAYMPNHQLQAMPQLQPMPQLQYRQYSPY